LYVVGAEKRIVPEKGGGKGRSLTFVIFLLEKKERGLWPLPPPSGELQGDKGSGEWSIDKTNKTLLSGGKKRKKKRGGGGGV